MVPNLIKIVCLMALTVATSGQENLYLKEKPDFFRTCISQEPTFNQCYKENIQSLIYNFRYGIPGLPSVGQFEPVKIRKLRMEHNQLKVEMRNITIRGLGDTKVIDARLNPKDFSFKLKVLVPEMQVDAKYRTSGNIMFLQMNGSGKMSLQTANISLYIGVKIKLRTDFNTTFADITGIRTRIRDIGSFHINMENLFNGNTILEAQTNAIFNNNWREIIDVVRPTLEEGIDAVVLGRFRKIFNYIPAQFLIADVQSEEQAVNSTQIL